MKRYLLDTNHLSAYLDRHAVLQPRVDAALRAGDRFGICLPVHCEYQAGIRVSRRYQQNLARFQAALRIFRSWPVDGGAIAEFAEIFARCSVVRFGNCVGFILVTPSNRERRRP